MGLSIVLGSQNLLPVPIEASSNGYPTQVTKNSRLRLAAHPHLAPLVGCLFYFTFVVYLQAPVQHLILVGSSTGQLQCDSHGPLFKPKTLSKIYWVHVPSRSGNCRTDRLLSMNFLHNVGKGPTNLRCNFVWTVPKSDIPRAQ